MNDNAIVVHPDVAAALDADGPVVALETAVVTAGLPRSPAGPPPANVDDAAWDPSGPLNRELGRLLPRVVRVHGATPAVIAVMDGRLHIGLDDAALDALAANPAAGKTASRDLAAMLTSGATAGTTVSATLAACRIAGIRVFATGGMGGVHRGWAQTPDISSDLHAIATTPVCLVTSGAKSLLDLPATLEVLESLGAPVVGIGTDVFPQFYAAGDPSLRCPIRRDTPEAVAALCRTHWETLGETSGVIAANPIPEACALDRDAVETATIAAERAADEAGVRGRDRTPFVLAAAATTLGPAALAANVALLAANARLGARIAVAWSGPN